MINEAKKSSEKVLIINKKIFGEDHADVAGTYNNLGNVYQQLGQYNEAKEFLEKALITNKKIFGEDHADVAASDHNLGNVYQELGQYNEAKEFLEKALIIRKNIFGEDHADVREVLRNWEMFVLLLNKLKTTAVIITEKSLNFATKQGGKTVHPQVVASCRDLRIVDKCLRLRNQTEIKDCISIYSKREREQSLIYCGEALDSVRSEY